MAEMFKRTELNFGGAFAADRGLFVPNGGLTGVLMQNINVAYGQQVSRLYEIGASGQVTNVYYVGGRASGNFGTGHVIGPRVLLKAFYEEYSDVCRAGQNIATVSVRANCGGTAPIGGVGPTRPTEGAASKRLIYRLRFCVLTNVTLAVQASDFVINESSQLMFSNMDYDEVDA